LKVSQGGAVSCFLPAACDVALLLLLVLVLVLVLVRLAGRG
jgi:hypothetical protein